MRMRWRAAACLALGGVLVLFLAEAGFVRAAAAEALSLCASSVIPALFPFLVVSSLLLSLGLGELLSPMLAGLMEPLFRVDGLGSSALLLGLVGGYPIGAKTAADLYRKGLLSRPEAERLLAFCNNSNPVFLVSVLGSGVFGSVRTGLWLWLIHVCSALLAGLLFRGLGQGRREIPPPVFFQSSSLSKAIVSAVKDAAGGMLSVCAFVTLFYVLVSPLSRSGTAMAGLAVGITELFSLTPLLTCDRPGFLLAAGCAGWGGLSVLCQTAAVLDGTDLSLRPCFLGKLVQGLLSVLLAAVVSIWLF